MLLIVTLHLTFVYYKNRPESPGLYAIFKSSWIGISIFMKRTLLLLITSVSFFLSEAQFNNNIKKYPSLLWEITGNGIKKSSYLIGTMHVSSKLAFNLPDSFYIAVRNAQVVALETNPDTWQEDMSKYDLNGSGYNGSGSAYLNYLSAPNDFLNIKTLKFFKYDSKIERALYSNPSTINSLLYRSYGNGSSDFEEDTYLDMYIFQCGKKWGKKVTGVEDYGQSMQLWLKLTKMQPRTKRVKKEAMEILMMPIHLISCRKLTGPAILTSLIQSINTIVSLMHLMKNFCTEEMRYRQILLTPF